MNKYTYKYKLINKQSGEEHLCDKIVLDGYDYYVSDNQQLITDNCFVYDWHNKIIRKSGVEYGTSKVVIATNNHSIDIPQVVDNIEYDYDKLGESLINDALIAFEKKYGYSLQTKEQRDLKFKETGKGGDYLYYNYYDTDNEKLYLYYNEQTSHDQPYWISLELPLKNFIYPKIENNQDTHQFSEEDMVEFHKWLLKEQWFYNAKYNEFNNPFGEIKSTKELLQIWKEQQPIKLYYE